MALDALFFGAHPDDVELTSAGLAARLAAHGHAVGIVDLTRGEAASRGTVEERAVEARNAARVLGVTVRENLELPDTGLDRHLRAQLIEVVTALRTHRPRLVVAPSADDAHPDHVEASHLVARACYLSGLVRFAAPGERHRPSRLLFALYRSSVRPHLIVDVSEVWEKRMRALREHRSQLDPDRGPTTYLTQPGFLDEIEARARVMGAAIGARHGEGYRTRAPLGVHDARLLIGAGDES
ncbi:MAG TPA: bacillithiol biosynthesis deacetylase BshB1 [Candidatus Sulfotelmatobacter sp.]|nr:bacillithiol biosynthesis deacetylase BshB1 [Candidatus Sulfotelmatobacter sp.]